VTEAWRASGSEDHHAGAHVLVSHEFAATPWHSVHWCRPCTIRPKYEWAPALARTARGRGNDAIMQNLFSLARCVLCCACACIWTFAI
jgi:hypothetical protein